MKISLHTNSADNTRTVAMVLAKLITQPIAFLLSGDYGAGKTTFVQGIAFGLGITEPVRSPSYNIVKNYEGRLPLVHVDLYRTPRQADVDELAIGELLPKRGVLAVEWAREETDLHLDIPQVGLHIIVPPDSDGSDEQELRTLEFSLGDERIPIQLIEVIFALADR